MSNGTIYRRENGGRDQHKSLLRIREKTTPSSDSSFLHFFDNLTTMEIDGQLYPSNPGETYFISANVAHREIPGKQPPRILVIFIYPEILDEVMQMYGLSMRDLPEFLSFSTPPGLLECLKFFTEECYRFLPGQDQILNGLTFHAMHIIIRYLFNIEEKESSQIQRVTENFQYKGSPKTGSVRSMLLS